METEKIINENTDGVSRYVFEAATASLERSERKMTLLAVLMSLALIGSNLAWIIHFFG